MKFDSRRAQQGNHRRGNAGAEHAKPGLDERIYENALVLELKAAGHLIEQQRQFPVIYRDINVGTLIPDLIVDGM